MHDDVEDQMRLVESEQTTKQNQVAGARNGQELGQSLDNSQDESIEVAQAVASNAVGPLTISRKRSAASVRSQVNSGSDRP